MVIIKLNKKKGHFMNFGFRNEAFLVSLRETLQSYQGIVDFVISGILWEQVIKKAANTCGLEVTWNPNSHKRGWDMIIEEKKTSVKGGVETKDNYKFAAYRTTSEPLLADKISMMQRDKRNFDCYLYLSKNKSGNNVKYTLWTFPANFCDFTSFQWTETEKAWKSNIVSGIQLSIVKSLSEQVWVRVNKDKMNQMGRRLFSWTIENENMGQTHKIVRK